MARRNARAEKLTKTVVEAAQPKPARYRINDTQQAGFFLMVYPSGRRCFGVRYVTADGRETDTQLGDYPALLPTRAREEAGRLRSRVRLENIDPNAERRTTRRDGVESRERTVGALGEAYLSHEKRRGRKSAATLAKARHCLQSSIYPHLGRRPVAEIDHHEISDILWKVKEVAAQRSRKTGAGAANDARKYLLQLFAYAQRLGWIAGDPMRLVEKFPEKPRNVMASDAQLKTLWAVWEARRAAGDERGRDGAAALQFMTLTLQRGEEIAQLPWSEIDWDRKIWVIPAERKKEQRAAAVPLSSQAIELLRSCQAINGNREGPFAGRKGEGKLRRNSLTQSFRRDCARLEIENLTPHDLRRTGRTIMSNPERLGIAIHVAELVLNHSTGSQLQRTYDLNAYLTEKRDALDAWGSEVEQIVADGARDGVRRDRGAAARGGPTRHS